MKRIIVAMTLMLVPMFTLPCFADEITPQAIELAYDDMPNSFSRGTGMMANDNNWYTCGTDEVMKRGSCALYPSRISGARCQYTVSIIDSPRCFEIIVTLLYLVSVEDLMVFHAQMLSES